MNIKSFAFKLSIGYILIGLIYIFTSDFLVELSEVSEITTARLTFLQNIKGSIFIFTTGILLYLVVWRFEKRLNTSLDQVKRKNEVLTKYAMMTCHELKKPAANLEGLLKLLDTGFEDQEMIMRNLKNCVDDLNMKLLDSVKLIEQEQSQA